MEYEVWCPAVSPHGTKCSLPLHLGTHYCNRTQCLWESKAHLHDANLAGAVEQCRYEYPSGFQCHNATVQEFCRAHADEAVEPYHGQTTGGAA